MTSIPRESFDRIVVIDGTWIQAKQICNKTPVLQKMQRVTIAPRKTHFWRYQNVDDFHLATIEAIYYLYREFGEAYQAPYDGSYDNLLFYYKFFYNMIQDNYSMKSASFSRRHQQKDYIKYDKSDLEENKQDKADKKVEIEAAASIDEKA